MRLAVLTPRTPPPSPAAALELEAENPALFHLWLRSGEPLGPYLSKRGRSLSIPTLSRPHRMTCVLPPAPHDLLPSRQEPCLTVPRPHPGSRLQSDGSQHSPMPHWQGLATPTAAPSQQCNLQHGGSQLSPVRSWRELGTSLVVQPQQSHHSTLLPPPQQQWSPLPQPQQQWSQPQPDNYLCVRLGPIARGAP